MVEYLVGKKVKDLRVKQNLTIDEVANRASLSKSLVSKIENNKTSPPIATLLRIAKALNVHIGYFFEQNPLGGSVILSRNNNRSSFTREKKGIKSVYEPLALELSNGTVQPYLITASSDPSESQDEEFDQHDGDEFTFVLEGKMEIVLGSDKTYLLEKGDSLYFNANIPHHEKLVEGKPVKYFVVLISNK
ncbi:MAG: helix-turn-helix transcriptional regulator [Spirochaetales bacterium]|nr:helix-turn-helix transcriptional regulator [Spirochaetales bacterium]